MQLHLQVQLLLMEGVLSKKSIRINDSFLHANYIGIMINYYSIIDVYMWVYTFVTCIYGCDNYLLLVYARAEYIAYCLTTYYS